MKDTAYTAFVNTTWGVVVGLLVTISVWTYALALQGDTTLLGDPYYEDQVLAPDRAFGPWALSLLLIGLVSVLRLVQWWQNRK